MNKRLCEVRVIHRLSSSNQNIRAVALLLALIFLNNITLLIVYFHTFVTTYTSRPYVPMRAQ
jgi:hypothetical protein